MMKVKIYLSIVFIAALILSLNSNRAFAAIHTQDELQQAFATESRPIKIILVPGHDTEYWGTEYRNVHEGDLTLMLGQYLYALLKQDPHFDVTITRDGLGQFSYTPQFANYFSTNTSSIMSFISSTRTAYTTSVTSGSIQKLENVPHNNANSDVALRLYGINKWINDNDIDLALHIHFNDNPSRAKDYPGGYKGFAIYIPEKQYDNGAVSAAWGASLYNVLKKYYPQSTLPIENVGLVPEQDLIAIGPGNSLKAGSALIEYSYIYEPQFLNSYIRSQVIKDYAYQTYRGIYNFFGTTTPQATTLAFGTPILPYTWARASSTVKYGTLSNPDVLALQAALRSYDLYPPENMDLYTCHLTGNFDPCTQKALKEFQREYGIQATGNLGPLTRKALNRLFSTQ